MSDYIKTEKVLDLLAGVVAEIIMMQPEHTEEHTETHSCVSPCDVCKHYPPSSADGKPCSMCPAEPAEPTEQVRAYMSLADCVSRQAAIDALTHKWDGMVTSVFDVLKELPPAEPHWIPVSERLPEIPCVACDKYDQMFIPRGIVIINEKSYDGEMFEFSSVEKFLEGKDIGNGMRILPREIIAWMPLPEPWKDGEE